MALATAREKKEEALKSKADKSTAAVEKSIKKSKKSTTTTTTALTTENVKQFFAPKWSAPRTKEERKASPRTWSGV